LWWCKVEKGESSAIILDMRQRSKKYCYETDDVVIKPSDIHGLGTFAKRVIEKGEIINPHIEDKFAFPGFNHSCNYNVCCRCSKGNGGRVLRRIEVGEELTVKYGNKEWIESSCNCDKCRKRSEN
jgi:SET domain-containing protein